MLTPKELELYSLPGMQKFLRDVLGLSLLWETLYDPIEKSVCICVEAPKKGFITVQFPDGATLRHKEDFFDKLPLPIDQINPERGLIEMLAYPPSIHYNEYLASLWVVDTYDVVRIKTGTYCGVTPTEALLRALMAQEGIEE